MRKYDFNKKIICILIGITVLCLTGCCDHKWDEATCEAPKTCSVCGITEGDVSHEWNEAGCADIITCNKCGTTSEAIGHKWQEASCVSPRTCTECKEIDGEALDHSTRLGDCSRYGEKIDDVEYKDGFAIVTYVSAYLLSLFSYNPTPCNITRLYLYN